MGDPEYNDRVAGMPRKARLEFDARLGTDFECVAWAGFVESFQLYPLSGFEIALDPNDPGRFVSVDSDVGEQGGLVLDGLGTTGFEVIVVDNQ